MMHLFLGFSFSVSSSVIPKAPRLLILHLRKKHTAQSVFPHIQSFSGAACNPFLLEVYTSAFICLHQLIPVNTFAWLEPAPSGFTNITYALRKYSVQTTSGRYTTALRLWACLWRGVVRGLHTAPQNKQDAIDMSSDPVSGAYVVRCVSRYCAAAAAPATCLSRHSASSAAASIAVHMRQRQSLPS